MRLFLILMVVGSLVAVPLAINSQAAGENEKQVAENKEVAQATKKKQPSQIEQLKEQLEQIQRQNQQQIEELQRKIQDLEVKGEAQQEKIEEVKKEDKDAWYNKVSVSYKKPGDGFTIETKDGNFLLNMRLRAQFQFYVDDTTNEDTATGFKIRRFRLYWIGNAFRPWFKYYVQVSADASSTSNTNSDVQIRDMYFDAAYRTEALPRVGQYKVPFNREELTSSSSLQLVERSIVNEEFSLARDIGTSLYGLLGNYFVYGGGVFNGDGKNAFSTDSNMLYAGRIMFTPCCGKLKYANESYPIGGDYKIEPNFGEDKPLIAFGVAAAGMEGLNITQKTPDSTALVDRFDQIGIDEGNFEQITADVNFKYKAFSIEGEYDGRWIQPEAGQGVSTSSVFDQGFRVQSGVFLLPCLVEVAGRFAYIDYDNDVPGPTSSYEITPGLNFYMSRSHKWKIQLSYSYIKDQFNDSSDVNENVFRAQLQAYF
jgi:TolA-binding protein